MFECLTNLTQDRRSNIASRSCDDHSVRTTRLYKQAFHDSNMRLKANGTRINCYAVNRCKINLTPYKRNLFQTN